MSWTLTEDSWPELMTTVTGRVTAVEPATAQEPPRAWVGAIGPLHPATPELAERLTPGAYVRVAYHRDGGRLTADHVRVIG